MTISNKHLIQSGGLILFYQNRIVIIQRKFGPYIDALQSFKGFWGFQFLQGFQGFSGFQTFLIEQFKI
ncbi:hypothetical protein PD374_26955 [Pseudomonas sp. WCS374]|nr:hypothetical protein PD374_26955 [Pseudomonas sp. WCS374]